MKKTTKRATKPKIEPIGEYKLTVCVGGNTFTTQTDDLKSAILALKPEKIVNRVLVTIEKGGKKFERNLFVFKARMIFYNPLACQFFVKNAELMLK